MKLELYKELTPEQQMLHDLLSQANHHLNRIADVLETILAMEAEQ